ncbi:hypothetical protein [Maritalea mediterranea]|uniref:DUF3631 domain-containing protein n=1 Tax=Maritalea mediterranea TaxID=2909667 RepID=A0ABS9EAP9_9HYPH|nr:hypothetical protein [Maritalea mediterranea]MCF4099917.1 hypothetical protein [Maritalea mediterranea]
MITRPNITPAYLPYAQPYEHEQTPPSPRPVIQYIDSELPKVVSKAMKALVESRAPIFARGTSLVRPVIIQQPQNSTLDGVAILVSFNKIALVEMLTEIIEWQRWDGRINDFKKIACPTVVAETILSRAGDWPFPQIKTVASAPTLRPDGTVISAKGFDTETGILFVSDRKWPPIPIEPTFGDAKASFNILRDLISTFPFVSEADHAATMSMLLTAIVRPALTSAPMFGVTAPTPGTGKSKLVDIAAILATGQPASVLSAPREEAEMQKQIGAMLMQGESFLTIDNIEHPLRSEFLCQVLTQSNVTVRVLGESRAMKLPTGATFCATGNSLRFAGDLTRRVVLICLDACTERPENRVFDNDVVKVALERRVELVNAGLTVLRAFVTQRAKKVKPPLGSFEEWSNLVRSAVTWLGGIDPLSSSDTVRDLDPERERTSAALQALPTDRTWTTSEISKIISRDTERHADFREHEVLSEALAEMLDRNGHLNTIRFGHFLKKHAGRIIDGRRISNRGKNRANVALWTIEKINSNITQ